MELQSTWSRCRTIIGGWIEAGGKYFHLNFGVTDGRLTVHLSDQNDEGAEWEGDNREMPIP